MAERMAVVDIKPIDYEGIFKVAELIKFLYEWGEEHGYARKDLSHKESVTKQGKNIKIVFELTQPLEESLNKTIKVYLIMDNIKEVVVESDGNKANLNQGKVHMNFSGYLDGMREEKWEVKPIFTVLKSLFDKYIAKPITQGPEGKVAADVGTIHSQTKAFLNLYRY